MHQMLTKWPTADGLDDLVCIHPNGDLQLSINNGDGSGSTPPTFKDLGIIRRNSGRAQEFVRLADIDGDGRGDYCHLDDG